jgi:chromosome segregation ATPase
MCLLASLSLALFAGLGATGRLSAQTSESQDKAAAELARKRAEQADVARTKAEEELARARDEATALKARLDKERRRAEQLEKEAQLQRDRARAAVEDARKEIERFQQDAQAQRDRAEQARQDAEAALKKSARDRDLALVEELERARLQQQKATQAIQSAAAEAMLKDFDQRAARLRQGYQNRRDALLAEVKALDAQARQEIARMEEQKAAMLAALKERGAKVAARAQPAAGDKLDRILERLDRIEKRLDRLEKMPLRAVPRLPQRPGANPFFERQ